MTKGESHVPCRKQETKLKGKQLYDHPLENRKMSKNTNIRISLPVVCFVWQIAMIILFGVFIRYDEESDTHWIEHMSKESIPSHVENDFYYRYPSKYHHHFQCDWNSVLMGVFYQTLCFCCYIRLSGCACNDLCRFWISHDFYEAL